MTAQELVRLVREDGIEMEARGGRLILRPAAKVTDAMREWIPQERDVILWALYRRLGGHPLNELWLKPDHWQTWMEMCDLAQERRAA